MNAIPCLTWVKKGASKRNPERLLLTEDEINRLVHSQSQHDEENEENEGSESSDDANNIETGIKRKLDNDDTSSEGDDIESEHSSEESDDANDHQEFENADEIDKKYDMGDYDDDVGGSANMTGMAQFSNNKQDPYILENDVDSDDEDMQILPEDNLIIVAKAKKGFCNFEAFVYNEKEQNCWCHHDLPLDSIPLCMEWLDFDPAEESPGNLMAMGTVKPDIEIWDLDVVDNLEPIFILSGESKKKSKNKRKKMNHPVGHLDAVLDLSWNKLQRNVLASASADFRVGIWDLSHGKMVTSITHHEEKVQTLEWHPVEAETLLSGSFDQTVKVYDCRHPESHKSWSLPGEVERVLWNKHNPFYFFAGCEDGHVYYYDVRHDKPVFTLQAHSKAVTGLAMCKDLSNCFATVSPDTFIKIWKLENNKPKPVWSKDLHIGQLQCIQGCPDSDLIFAVGGESELHVLNLKKNTSVVKEFNVKETGVSENYNEEIIAEGIDNDENDIEEESMGQEKVSDQHLKRKRKGRKAKN